MKLTQERLKSLLDYDPETGQFRWRVSRGGMKAGEIAGTVRRQTNSPDGYEYRQLVVAVDRRLYFAHRLAWFYVHNAWPKIIDHADGNGLNNRIANLRVATKRQNSANSRVQRRSLTGLKGATRNKHSGRYQARLCVGGRVICLGTFSTAEEANAAYAVAAKEHFGEFARP